VPVIEWIRECAFLSPFPLLTNVFFFWSHFFCAANSMTRGS
jgi:hypothetical protein